MSRDWESEHAAGRWDFLAKPHEQLRHAVIGCLIAQHAPGAVVDLGAGNGHLVRYLYPSRTTHYTAVDASATALEKRDPTPIPSDSIAATVEAYHPARRGLGALVAAEVLYFVDEPARELARIVAAAAPVGAVIVSLVAPNPAKPNWERNAAPIWTALGELRWPRLESVRVASTASGIGWDIALYRPTAA